MRFVLSGLLLIVLMLAGGSIAMGQKVRPIKVTAANAALYRDSLNERIFGPTGFPYSILPDSAITNVSNIEYFTGFPYSSIQYPAGNLDSIDKILYTVDPNNTLFPTQVVSYLFHPHTNNGKLFIYHAGHCAGTAVAEDVLGNADGTEPGIVIPALLAAGYTVLAVPMIHYQQVPPTGLVCGYNGHDPLFNDSLYTYPMGLFFTPLIASLNQLNRASYLAIYMCGLSGGGWATSVYPAMDSSISVSVPVAGSWPLALRSFFNVGGDSEQFYTPVFSGLLDYHELYTLSCLAPARKMLQINNRYDGCCFDGSVAHIFYADSVQKALQGTGGQFAFYLDESGTRHAITARAMQVIATFIAGEQGALVSYPEDSIAGGMNYMYTIGDQFTVNATPDPASYQYSLLKAPSWLSLNTGTGVLSGQAPPGSIVPSRDTVSFKVEDAAGRFVIHNYVMIKKRAVQQFFTAPDDDRIVFFLPFYAGSVSTVDPLSSAQFFFNNSSLSVVQIEVVQQSMIRLRLNASVSATDSIGYNGFNSPQPLTYNNGLKIDDTALSEIKPNAVTTNYARAGMIRFNSETIKFEYFNGTAWVNMH